MAEPELQPLPELLARVREVAGELAMQQFSQAFGGMEIYVGSRPREDGELARAVGFKAALAIAKEIGPGRIIVPLGPRATYTRIRSAIRALVAEGVSSNRIAHRLGCHKRTVDREVQRMRSAETPPLLRMMDRR